MAIEVFGRDFEDSLLFESGVSVTTESDYNNLEVVDSGGNIIAVYAGGQWAAAVVVADEDG